MELADMLDLESNEHSSYRFESCLLPRRMVVVAELEDVLEFRRYVGSSPITPVAAII